VSSNYRLSRSLLNSDYNSTFSDNLKFVIFLNRGVASPLRSHEKLRETDAELVLDLGSTIANKVIFGRRTTLHQPPLFIQPSAISQAPGEWFAPPRELQPSRRSVHKPTR
jgi:hypothetical protein